MPIYEYECPNCEQVQEVLQSHDDPPPKCTCTEDDIVMEKILSKGTFRLKGTGWYLTDYGDKK